MTKELLSISLQVSPNIHNVLINALNMYKELMGGNMEPIFTALKNNEIGNDEAHNNTQSFQKRLEVRYFNNNLPPDWVKISLLLDVAINAILGKMSKYQSKANVELNVEFTDKEYDIVLRALNLYGRLLMGQTRVIEDTLMFNGVVGSDIYVPFQVSDGIRTIFFENKSSSLVKSPKDAQRAIGLYANLRYKSGLDKNNVWGHEPMSYLGDEVLEVTFN